MLGELIRRGPYAGDNGPEWDAIFVDLPQEDVLRLGLNFTPAPTKLPLVDTIAAVEEGARQLNEEDAEDLRGRVCGILRRAKPPKDNLSKEQRKALKELRSLKNEVILPADKG